MSEQQRKLHPINGIEEELRINPELEHVLALPHIEVTLLDDVIHWMEYNHPTIDSQDEGPVNQTLAEIAINHVLHEKTKLNEIRLVKTAKDQGASWPEIGLVTGRGENGAMQYFAARIKRLADEE